MSTTTTHQGIFAEAHAQAVTLVRTAIVNAVNSAQLASFADEGVTAIEWVSVLDDATTDICQELDGLQWTLPDYEPIDHEIPFPGPIAHWNCRSTQIAV